MNIVKLIAQSFAGFFISAGCWALLLLSCVPLYIALSYGLDWVGVTSKTYRLLILVPTLIVWFIYVERFKWFPTLAKLRANGKLDGNRKYGFYVFSFLTWVYFFYVICAISFC